MKVPCKGCPDRTPGCHENCDRFKTWRDERNAVLERKRQANEQTAYAYAYMFRHKRKG